MKTSQKIGQLIKVAEKPFFSLEYFPPSEPAQLESFFKTVDKLGKYQPLFVSVTYGAGGKKQQNTLEITEALSKCGFVTMAHLTCVGANPDAISSFLHELEKRGIYNVLALRGDPPQDQAWDWTNSQFRHATELVEFIKKDMPEMGVGVAVYPSPHPESPTFALDRSYTAKKLLSGADFGITQLFFDVREYIDLIAALKEKHIEIPVVPGILPIQSFDALKRVLSLCGANIPGKFYLELEAANDRGGAEEVREVGIKFALNMIRQLLDSGAPGIHLYTLNKSALCARIIEECGLGR